MLWDFCASIHNRDLSDGRIVQTVQLRVPAFLQEP